MAEPNSQNRDALTRLLGRDAMLAALARAPDDGRPLGLVELGRLVRYNDVAGEQAGDALLKTLARRLQRLMRAEFGARATLYRVGGARFAMMPPQSVPLARLRVELREILLGASDLLPETVDTLHRPLLRMAIGTVRPVSVEQDVARIAQRLSSRAGSMRAIDLDAVLRGDGLAVRLQPQFRVAGDRLTGAEALAYFNHPRLGEIGGAALFAAAARAGVERELSARVWRSAMDAMARWPRSLDGVRVHLNLTSRDLADPRLATELLDFATAARVDPPRLGVEVVESAALISMETARTTLGTLRAAGVHVALDDFGTAHSGFAWLRQLPVDMIKIDSDFAADAESGARDRAVLQGVLDLAGSLDVKVLVEGVESEEQLERIAAMGAYAYQGYLRAEPLTPAAFATFAAEWVGA